MRNAWNVQSLNGSVLSARVSQALGVFLLQASYEGQGRRTRALSVKRSDISTICLQFGLSRDKYYNIVEADIDEDGNLVKGLIKLKDIDDLTRKLGIKTSIVARAAEEAADIAHMITMICEHHERPLPHFIHDLASDSLNIAEVAQ